MYYRRRSHIFGSSVDGIDFLYEVEHVIRISLIIADIIVLISTWMKTYRNAREALNLQMNIRVTTLLLRDGICSQDCCHITSV